ncbi:MAG: hypothetical protein RLZZ397_363 [Pseudomonadota bacterium]
MLTKPEPSCTDLSQWLAYAESIHPQTIAMGLERVAQVAARMPGGVSFGATRVITVAGTNGKGSTCAMLEAILESSGYRTGVYTSPHLVHFEERCRVRTESVTPETLAQAMAVVEHARQLQPEVQLTYFEFTTLAILHVLQHSNLDVAILEVGLGGRLDAVNVVDADCAVLTCIDIDHIEYLGPDRESIGLEKAGIMRPGKPAIVADPVPPQSVIDHAAAVGAQLWVQGQQFSFSGDKQQWQFECQGRRMGGLAYPALRGANQLINASGVLAALQAMRPELPVTAQAIRAGLANVELAGRFQVLAGQPTRVFDVAHNPHAVATLVASLDAQGFFPNTRVVFGAMADKDLLPMMQRMAPLVDHWMLTDLPGGRAAKATDLERMLRSLPLRAHVQVTVHEGPDQAWQEALKLSDPADRIVVFGSFVTVGAVLSTLTRSAHV